MSGLDVVPGSANTKERIAKRMPNLITSNKCKKNLSYWIKMKQFEQQ